MRPSPSSSLVWILVPRGAGSTGVGSGVGSGVGAGVGTGVGAGVGAGVGVGVGSVAPVMVMAMDCDELSDAVRVNESVRVSPAFSALTAVLELSRV